MRYEVRSLSPEYIFFRAWGWKNPGRQQGRGSPAQSLVTSADALLLARQDPGSVDDTDAVQDWVGQLCTHEPAGQ